MNRIQATMISTLLCSTLGVSVGWSQKADDQQQSQQQQGQNKDQNVQHDDSRSGGDVLNTDASDDAKKAVLQVLKSAFGNEIKNIKFSNSTYEGRQNAFVWAMERGISLLPGTGIYGVEFDSREGTHLQCTYVQPMNQKRVILRNCVIELNLDRNFQDL